MARDWPTTLVLNLPTAQALLVEVAATADRKLTVPGPGAGTCVQAVPAQRRMRPCSVALLSDRPTARALVVEVAVTPLRRVLIPGPGFGTAALVHVLPFQCRARAWAVSLALAAAPTMVKPTAQASLAE